MEFYKLSIFLPDMQSKDVLSSVVMSLDQDRLR